MHFPHFNSLVAALILFGTIRATPIPQDVGVGVDVDLGLDVDVDVDVGPFDRVMLSR